MTRTIAAACLLLLGLTSTALAEERKEPFYSQIGRTVIRLEHVSETFTEGNTKAISENNPDGTGFFVWSGDRLFLVTARHVVDTNHDTHARVKVFNEVTKTSEILLLNLPRGNWIFHPDNGDEKTNPVDLAVMKLTVPVKEGFAGNVRGFVFDPTNAASNQLPPEDALPPEQVVTFGFPGDVGFQLLEQRPMARLGIISMHTGEKFITVEQRFANERCDILDIKAFPGNSGSPVMGATEGTHLLGVVIASNNSDIAIMEPVSRIRELLEIARKTPLKNFDYWVNFK
jgi:hypothetical protein